MISKAHCSNFLDFSKKVQFGQMTGGREVEAVGRACAVGS